MNSIPSEKPFPLLDLPAELRDMVYEHVLFASAWTTDTAQRRENLKNGVLIHTNILLTSRLVFEEARNVIIDAQLIKVSLFGEIPKRLRSAAAIQDGIPMFQKKYRKFCLLKHEITDHHHMTQWGTYRDLVTCIIRKEDVFRFCGGIPGLNPNLYAPQMLGDSISHCLALSDPTNMLPEAQKRVSIRVPTHNRLLKEYQKALAGCQDIWIYGHWSLGQDEGPRRLMRGMAKKIMSSNPSRIESLNGRLLIEEEDNAGQDFQGIFII